ncbi:MAG: ABC transporter permease, partial [Oscillospiraceae bacterium]|nr:ABC transporter permease [Oscillospiraceae bacterium]
MTLFFKECKKVIFSMTFLIYTVVTFAMYFTQYDSDRRPLEKPAPGQESYGMTAKEVPEILMPAAAQGLISEYISGSYTAYPIGFYKSVRLSEKKKERMTEIILEISGVTEDALENYRNELDDSVKMIYDSNGNLTMVQQRIDTPEINIPEDMTYEHFRDLMREADSLIGGGSKYSDQYIVGEFSLVPKTYEDALAEYEDIFYKEKISPAYARLFCDYMCIDLAVLPVFAAAALTDKDKRSQMCELINSRCISSARLVITRYLALVTVML